MPREGGELDIEVVAKGDDRKGVFVTPMKDPKTTRRHEKHRELLAMTLLTAIALGVSHSRFLSKMSWW